MLARNLAISSALVCHNLLYLSKSVLLLDFAASITLPASSICSLKRAANLFPASSP